MMRFVFGLHSCIARQKKHDVHSSVPLLLALFALFLLLDFFLLLLLLNFLLLLLLPDLYAEQFVPTPVEVALLLAAVPPHVTAWTSEQLRSVLVRCAGVARCVVAALGILACSLSYFLDVGY